MLKKIDTNTYSLCENLQRGINKGTFYNPECHTCAALDGSDGGGRCAWWGGWQKKQRPPPFSFLFPSTALVDRPNVAVASHPEASWHRQGVHGVHAVHGSLHGLGLHLTVDLLTHLLNLTIHLHLTQLEEERRGEKEGWHIREIPRPLLS